MRVAIDARVEQGVPGGIQQVILGTAAGLGRLDDGSHDDYRFLVTRGHEQWLRAFIRPPCRLVATPRPHARGLSERVRNRLRRLLTASSSSDQIERDSILERSGADVVHLLRQNAPSTSIPSIYHPYDLQHLHLPQFFSAEARKQRDRLYRGHCERARFVVMMTQWAKEDLCTRLQVPETNVAVVPLPPILRILGEPNPSQVREFHSRNQLPETFALYPAQTWPHKNHVNLLKALAVLRDKRGLNVPLVCCGTKNDFFPEIKRVTSALGLESQVRFLGWIDDSDLNRLYRCARCLLFPSLFEGWGMPITESFEVGLPVACTDAPWLPGLMRGSVVTFDPSDPASIADGVARVWSDDRLRGKLMEEGLKRAESLSWIDVAVTFRALYRAASGEEIKAADLDSLGQAGVAA